MTEKPTFYRRLLAHAWRVAWEHKHLWLLGFFATFAGFGSVSEIFFHAFDRLSETAPRLAWIASPWYLLPGSDTIVSIFRISPYPILTLALFLFAATVFLAIFVWAMVVSVGAIITSADRVGHGHDTHFADSVKLGAMKFWRLFWLLLACKAVIAVALLVTGGNLAVLVRDSSLVSSLFFLLSFIVFTAAAIAVSIAAVYAAVEIVVRDAALRPAWEAGWRTFTRNWLLSLETVLLLLGVNVAVGLIAIAAVLVLSVPYVFLLLLSALLGLKIAVGALTGIGAVVLLVVIVAYGSFMTVFQVAAWTRLYEDLTTHGPRAWLMRLADWWAARSGK